MDLVYTPEKRVFRVHFHASNGTVLHSKRALHRYLSIKGHYTTMTYIDKLMYGRQTGTFTLHGMTWTFVSIIAGTDAAKLAEPRAKKGKAPAPATEKEIKTPYTKKIGDLLCTYSGHTGRLIHTQTIK